MNGKKAGEQTTNIILRTQNAGRRVTLVGAGQDACGGPGASSRILLQRILEQHLLCTVQRFKATSRFPLTQRRSGSSLNVNSALARACPTECDPRPTDRQTDRRTDRSTDRPTDRPTDGPTDPLTDRSIDRPTDRRTDPPIDRSTDRPTDRPTDRSTDRPTDRPTT